MLGGFITIRVCELVSSKLPVRLLKTLTESTYVEIRNLLMMTHCVLYFILCDIYQLKNLQTTSFFFCLEIIERYRKKVNKDSFFKDSTFNQLCNWIHSLPVTVQIYCTLGFDIGS